MSDLVRYQGGALQGSAGRKMSRQLSRLEAGTSLARASIETSAEIQACRADAVAFVGRRALENVALLSQVEQQLAQAVPHASGRLAAIADLTAIALSQVVADTARQVGR